MGNNSTKNKKEEVEKKKEKIEGKNKKEEENKKIEKKKKKEDEKKKKEEEKKKKKEKKKKGKEKKEKEKEKEKISKTENIKKESNQSQKKEEKNEEKNETNQIIQNNKKINRKYTFNQNPNQKNEENNIAQRIIDNFQANKNDNNKINQEKKDIKKSVILDDKNKAKNKILEIGKEKIKEKENADDMRNSDIISIFDKKENILNQSLRKIFPKINDNRFMINDDEQEMDFNLFGGNEKEIDNEIILQNKNDENIIINTISKNDDNKIEDNEINKKEIIKEDKDKNNENKINNSENKEKKETDILLDNIENNMNLILDDTSNISKGNKEENIEYEKCNSPNYFLVLEKINIFNSVLIILNNISFNIDYFSSNIDNIINICQLNNAHCLASIIYYINKFLWKTDGYLKISENYIKEKYIDFITYYSEVNSLDKSLSQNYCYNPQNVRNILKFIFNKINTELTSVNGPKKNNNYNNCDPKFLSNLNNINKKYNSILSENMMGLYEYRTFCDYCMFRATNYKTIYNYEYQYEKFYEITFNLNEINYYYKNKNSSQLTQMKTDDNNNFNSSNLDNEKQNIYLEKCFYYSFFERNKKVIREYCYSCRLNANKSQYNLIYSPPNILTLILVNNEKNENWNFIFQDELNIKKYILNSKNDRIYLLISCLCRLSNTGKYICYCINPKDSYWYSYSDEKINRVEKIDEYAVPLILFYQSKITMNFKYKKLMIINKVNLTVKFNNGMEPKNMSFNMESRIKSVIEEILSTINLKGAKVKFLINGERTKEDEILSKYLEENNSVLLMISK